MSSFSEKIKAIDGGRFAKIVDALDVKDACEKCYYFNPNITDPMQGYRCNVAGSCPAATLSDKLQKYIWKNVKS